MNVAGLKVRTRAALGDRREEARRVWFMAPGVRRRLRRRALEAWSQETIAFVCRGNICRSPFAERLLNGELAGRTVSAGYLPEAGRPSPDLAVDVADGLGVDLRSHRSRVVDQEFVDDADAIFVFDEENYRTIRRDFPAARPNLHFLGALAEDGPLFIPDPYGGAPEKYEAVYGRIIDLAARGAASAARPTA
jgi:protein-tyrosine-phosphatase